MKIAEILAKIVKGENLTDEEKKFLAEYKEPEPDPNRIPKERLDEEIAKRKASEAKEGELQTKLSELESKVEELTTKGMSEAEKAKRESAKTLKTLQDQVAALTKERDESKAKAEEMEFRGKVAELANAHRFTDADYLGWKLKSGKINLEDATAVSGFFAELEKSAPALFQSEAKGGAGTGGENSGSNGGNAYQSRIDELLKKPSLTMRESQEVIELQGKIAAEKSASAGTNNQSGGNANPA